MLKDATLTIRVPRATRRRLEAAARREGRSLSQLAERLIENGLNGLEERPTPVRPLAGLLARESAPEYGEFRGIRTLLSDAFTVRSRRGPTGR